MTGVSRVESWGFQPAADFETIHTRHHGVQQNQIYIRFGHYVQGSSPSEALSTW